jgi:hypothetical protein
VNNIEVRVVLSRDLVTDQESNAGVALLVGESVLEAALKLIEKEVDQSE